jgi:hypothetical protein
MAVATAGAGPTTGASPIDKTASLTPMPDGVAKAKMPAIGASTYRPAP